MCASPGHATLLREQPSGRGKVMDNSRSVIDGSWSILIIRRVIITRDWRIVIKGGRALPQDVGVSLAGITPAITPGDAHSTTTGAAPDVPHHETASTRPNPRVEDTFDNAHATGASGTTPPTTCVNFTCTERDPLRISEEENRVIQIPNDILRIPSSSRISIVWNQRNRNYRS